MEMKWFTPKLQNSSNLIILEKQVQGSIIWVQINSINSNNNKNK